MNKNLLLTRIAAIVITLEETNGSPESMLYMFVDMNMAHYEIIRDVLLRSGMITIKGHYVTLTADGKETARKLNEVITKKESN